MSDPERGTLHLFEAVGVELEYMLVDEEGLDVLPVADRVLAAASGGPSVEAALGVSEVERGRIAWSNELVLHVLELKTNGPARRLDALPDRFRDEVGEAAAILSPLGGTLLPGGMHPWMDPETETRLWPHEHSPVYEAYDRIFGCRGHGWSNLQSLHLNLPFSGDDEFGRLSAAVRLVLPLLPALAASSPVVEGRLTGLMDNRLEVYRHNSDRIPSVAGAIVPEAAYTRSDYERMIFEPMMADVAPHDPDGVLEKEFLNSRGAIARFGRGSIEIRLLDVQETPRADLAIAALVVATLRLLTEERWAPLQAQCRVPVEPLAELLVRSIRSAELTLVDDDVYLSLFGYPGPTTTIGELWRHLSHESRRAGLLPDQPWREPLEVILEKGPLARRLAHALPPTPDRDTLRTVYRRLARCLARDELFV